MSFNFEYACFTDAFSMILYVSWPYSFITDTKLVGSLLNFISSYN
jgi:hypothetical protein